MGCIPAHAIYFSIYEKAKQVLDCDNDSNHHKFALVGICSALFHDLVMTPTEVLKQRMQLLRSHSSHLTILSLSRWMYKNEGPIAFYRSFGVNYMMNMPLGAMVVFFNEKIKYLAGVRKNDDVPLKYFACAGAAGALAAVPTCPFDVIKTKLNTQSCLNSACEQLGLCCMMRPHNKVDYALSQKAKTNPGLRVKMGIASEKLRKAKYSNIMDTARKIWAEDGALGFFSGLKMRVTIQSLSSAIAWGTYHIVKNAIYKDNYSN
jgi:solute carrier family 25 iron transporter 28/37